MKYEGGECLILKVFTTNHWLITFKCNNNFESSEL